MEEQEKSQGEESSLQRDQTQNQQDSSETGAATGTEDLQGNQAEKNTSASPSPNMPQASGTTKRQLPSESASETPSSSTAEMYTSTATASASSATMTNSDVSNKRFKAGNSPDNMPEAQTTPPTPSAIPPSNPSSTAAIENPVQRDANYSISTAHAAAASQPPPTPPPSAASTATNASSIAPPDSPNHALGTKKPESMTNTLMSPRKTSASSFDTASGWTDDDAYERMPKTPVAPPQSSSARKAFRQSAMSPLPNASGVFLPDVPPAPPTTPAPKQTATLPFHVDMGLATPLPYTAGFVQNANQLEQQQRQSEKNFKEQKQQAYQQQLEQEIPEGAATPAPPRPQQEKQKASKPPRPTTSLSDDFSEWAVGDRYKLSRMLGRGSYGEVAQAIDLYQGRPDAFVAIKRIVGPFDQEVDAVRLFREIHILRRLRTLGKNDCIVPLLDVVQPPTDDLNDFHDLYLVFDYVDTDLYKLIMSPQYLTTEHIQTFLYQMLIGLKYIHSGNVIHRDLKPANILLNEDCSLKICDFGLARIVDEISVARDNDSSKTDSTGNVQDPAAPALPTRQVSPRKNFISRSCSVSEEMLTNDSAAVSKLPLTRQLTKHVVTRWYRAPELILIQPYTTAVDVWSLGCIFAELLSMQEGSVPGYQDRTPLFPGGACYPLSGDTDNAERLDQLNVIFNVIGTPSKDDIANIGSANEYIKNMKPIKPKNLKDIYPAADPNALDLLQMMLKFNPKERCTAGEALSHKFFAGIRREEMETSVEAPMESPAFLNEQEIDIETLKQKAYNEVLWFRDNQSKENLSATPAATTPTVTQTEEDLEQPAAP